MYFTSISISQNPRRKVKAKGYFDVINIYVIHHGKGSIKFALSHGLTCTGISETR